MDHSLYIIYIHYNAGFTIAIMSVAQNAYLILKFMIVLLNQLTEMEHNVTLAVSLVKKYASSRYISKPVIDALYTLLTIER